MVPLYGVAPLLIREKKEDGRREGEEVKRESRDSSLRTYVQAGVLDMRL